MPFQKGQSGNPKGRKPGVAESKKRNLAEQLAQFLNDDFAKDGEGGFMEDWCELSAANRMRTRGQLYEYILKKLSRSETVVDVSKLSESEVNALLDTIRERYDDDDDEAENGL
jgi:hypothetical protein